MNTMDTATHSLTDCDYCGAAAGAPCTTASGRPATKPHAAREKAADAIRTEQPETPQRFGYVCKSCGGPAPVGIGYAAPGAAAEGASADLNACACGYSVRTVDAAPAVEAALEAAEPAAAPAVETVTPLREAIASGIQQRGTTTFRPAGLTATIEVYTPDQSPEPEATIHYEGDTLTGYRDDRWGYIERESWVVETTWAEDADGLLDTLAVLVKKHWEITLIEVSERIARDLAAAAALLSALRDNDSKDK